MSFYRTAAIQVIDIREQNTHNLGCPDEDCHWKRTYIRKIVIATFV